MLKFMVESGIKIPPPGHRGTDPNSLTARMKTMKVGESILVESDSASTSYPTSCAKTAWGAGHYVSRKVEGGIRIWRVKGKEQPKSNGA